MAEDFDNCIKLGTLNNDAYSTALSNEAEQGFLETFKEKYFKEYFKGSEQTDPESSGSESVLLLCKTHTPKIELYPGDMYHLPGIIIDGKRM